MCVQNPPFKLNLAIDFVQFSRLSDTRTAGSIRNIGRLAFQDSPSSREVFQDSGITASVFTLHGIVLSNNSGGGGNNVL